MFTHSRGTLLQENINIWFGCTDTTFFHFFTICGTVTYFMSTYHSAQPPVSAPPPSAPSHLLRVEVGVTLVAHSDLVAGPALHGHPALRAGVAHQAAASAAVMPSVELQGHENTQSHTHHIPAETERTTRSRFPLRLPLTMVNLSRWQTMQTCCWVSGTQFFRAGG